MGSRKHRRTTTAVPLQFEVPQRRVCGLGSAGRPSAGAARLRLIAKYPTRLTTPSGDEEEEEEAVTP